jgi:hypothetical protein
MKRASARRLGSHKPEPTQPTVPIVASSRESARHGFRTPSRAGRLRGGIEAVGWRARVQ